MQSLLITRACALAPDFLIMANGKSDGYAKGESDDRREDKSTGFFRKNEGTIYRLLIRYCCRRERTDHDHESNKGRDRGCRQRIRDL